MRKIPTFIFIFTRNVFPETQPECVKLLFPKHPVQAGFSEKQLSKSEREGGNGDPKGPQERKPSPPEVSQMKIAEVVVANQQTKPKVMQTQDGGNR